jgi:cyclohexanone monooxygenase
MDFDVIVVGAGFAGMYMLHRLRRMGFKVRGLETGSGVGGTWYWNRYPGARCDVESVQYSYQFDDALQQEWDWSERYAPQPEILRYANHVADRYDLCRDIQFNTRVTAATFSERDNRWQVETEKDERLTARFIVMATGCLSSSNTPKFPGLKRFKGKRYHTGHWPHEGVDFTGQRVGVIGTGSSAIQSIPIMAQQATHLTVFQRTPNYTIPAHNALLDPAYKREVKANYAALRARAKQMIPGIDFKLNPKSALEVTPDERRREYQARWDQGGLMFAASFADVTLNQQANDTAAEFVRDKIRSIVSDPRTAEALMPSYTIGCKRLCVDTGYWATFNRPNVTLIDVAKQPIEAITESGVKVGDKTYEVDALVLATGFDAMTGALLKVDIRGRGGKLLREKWNEGPRAYLGLAMAGFPNLFTVTGPGSPSVLTNMLPSIEQHVEWIADCIGYLRDRGKQRIEPETTAEDAWVAHVGDLAGATLRHTCNSWYLGSNIAGKPKVFMPYTGGFPAYVAKCNDVAAKGYDGFALG